MSEEQTATVKLLAPHFRRVVAISNILNLAHVKSTDFATAPDAIAVGIVPVDDEDRVLHAKTLANLMMARGASILARHGRITCRKIAARAELMSAIRLEPRNRSGFAGNGNCISLASQDEVASVAHADADERWNAKPILKLGCNGGGFRDH
ncbi:MAG TPA: hypothetical protein PK264_14255 [Hyphomicrobiaceae bacterium]|nr:hypothetical protein [Hyphomicrobiaceae bacterium]